MTKPRVTFARPPQRLTTSLERGLPEDVVTHLRTQARYVVAEEYGEGFGSENENENAASLAHTRACAPSKGGAPHARSPADARRRAAAGGGVPAPVHAPARVREAPTVDEVVASFCTLASADRKKALALMSLAQQKSSPGEARDVDLWSEAVQEALVAALGRSDGAAHGPQVIRRLMGSSAAWGPVAEFMTSARLDGLKPAERFSAFRLLARLLVARCRAVARHADIPLTPKLVASNAVHIAGIFDAAFPGYLAAGFVQLVFKASQTAADRVGE